MVQYTDFAPMKEVGKNCTFEEGSGRRGGGGEEGVVPKEGWLDKKVEGEEMVKDGGCVTAEYCQSLHSIEDKIIDT